MKNITADHDMSINCDTYAEVICGNQHRALVTRVYFDRSFQPGETIRINEVNGCIPTGRQCIAVIGHVSSHPRYEGLEKIDLLNVKVTVS